MTIYVPEDFTFSGLFFEYNLKMTFEVVIKYLFYLEMNADNKTGLI